MFIIFSVTARASIQIGLPLGVFLKAKAYRTIFGKLPPYTQ